MIPPICTGHLAYRVLDKGWREVESVDHGFAEELELNVLAIVRQNAVIGHGV